MPIITTVASQEFFSQYRNGATWASLPLDTTYYLLGTVGEKIKAVFDIQIAWNTAINGSPNDGFIVNVNTITRQVGDFITDGFSIGDEVLGYWGADTLLSPTFATRTITALTSTSMTVDGASLAGVSTPLSWVVIHGTSDLEGCLFKYGIIENSEATNYNSKIDGNEQAYTVQGLVTSGTDDTMTPINNSAVKSWQNGTVSAQYTGSLLNDTLKEYTITHEFIVLPQYVDGYLTNIQNGTIPPLFAGANSLKYVFEANFKISVNNPNENKIITVDSVNGNSRYFNQALNTAPNQYTVSNIVITEVSSGDVSAGIITDSKTRYTFDLTTSAASFGGTEKIIIGVSLMPDIQDYAGNMSTVEENFLLDSLLSDVTGSTTSSTIIQDFTPNNPFGTDVVNISVDFEYTAAQQLLIDSTKKYFIWVLMGSDIISLPTNGANNADDRISLIVDSQNYVFNEDVSGILTIRPSDSDFYNQYTNSATSAGKTDFKGWIADNFTWKPTIRMNYAIGSEILAAKFQVIAHNSTTGDSFTLQEQIFPISANSIMFPTTLSPTGFVQILNVVGNRGFDLETSDQFNAFNFTTRLDGNGQPLISDNIQQYFPLIGFKLNFEDWLSLPNADAVFYDSAEDNNGLNKNASRYSLTNGYAIAARLEVEVKNVATGSTIYDWIADGEVYDFHLDDNVKTEYACKGFTSNVAETENFLGSIRKDQNTLIKFRFTPGVYVTGLEYVARIDCDEQEGSIFSIRDLSSLTGTLSGFNDASPISELIPISGLTGVKIVDDGVNGWIEITCLVDKDKVTVSKCYNLIGRLWNVGVLTGDELDTSDGGDPLTTSEGLVSNYILKG